jgi:HK97 family phage portal protein
MGLRQLRRRPVEDEQRDGQWWSLPGGYGYSTGPTGYGGSVETALRNAASWACINVISDAVSRTPFEAVRGTMIDAIPVNPPPSLVANPSGIVLPDVWYSQVAFSMATDGNAFGVIVAYDRAGWPTTVEWLDPATVSDRKVVNGRSTVKVNFEERLLYPFGDICHVPGKMVRPGSPFGLSLVDYANRNIGTSLAAEDFSYQFFNAGGHPTGLIFSERDLSPEQAASIKNVYRKAVGDAREPAVLGAGLKYQEIRLDPHETQFVELMQFEVAQACRVWGVPPSMVYAAISGQSITYANVTDYDLGFLKNTLDGYLHRLENALSSWLPRPQTVRADRDAILRSDSRTRAEIADIRLRNGTISRNEYRKTEGEPPIPGPFGNQYCWPPVGKAVGDLELQGAPQPVPVIGPTNGNTPTPVGAGGS